MNEGTITTRVGDYAVLGVLGAGGMGKVYKVRNVITDRVEAMKILLPDLGDRRDLADRFLREIKLLAGLSHPNIASLRTALTWDNQLVMIMEYVEGVTLSARLSKGRLSPAEAVDYMCQVLSALSYAHGLHIIHRDIKPANMMLTPEGVVKLMDFGIARSQNDPGLTASGSTLGSVMYMSPEQVKGEPADARSDIYSVGVSLYELVTGQRPFTAENEFAVMAAHLQKTPPAPNTLRDDLPPGLNEIVLTAMEKDPASRFQSADAFRNALQSLRLSGPLPAVEVPAATPGQQPAQDDDATGMAATPPASVISAVMRGSGEHKPPAAQSEAPAVPAAPMPAVSASMPAVSSPPSAEPPQTPAISGTSALAPSAQSLESPVQAPSSRLQPQSMPAPPAPLAVPPAAARPVTPGTAQRGLYIALGSVIVLIALVAAGLYIPRRNRTHAGGDRPTVTQPANPPMPPTPGNTPATTGNDNLPSASTSGGVSSQSAADSVNHPTALTGANTSVSGSTDSSAANAVPATPPLSPRRNVGTDRNSEGKASTGNTSTAIANPVNRATGSKSLSKPTSQEQRAAINAPAADLPSSPPPPSAEQLQQLEHDVDQLASRAESVDTSLDGLRQNQASQGLGLRGDIAASQQRMRTYMTRAQAAMKNRDVEAAKKYLALAETEVNGLEKFLGH